MNKRTSQQTLKMAGMKSEYDHLTGGDGSIEVDDVMRIAEWKEVRTATVVPSQASQPALGARL